MENNDRLKQRLVGAAVLISLVVVFLPMLVDDGPGPSPDRPAVPMTPEWKFSGWKEQQYQTPDQPQRPVVEVIDPATVEPDNSEAGAPQPDNGEPQGNQRQQADATPAASGGDTAPVAPAQSTGKLLEATVKAGDTLYGIFRRLGLEPTQVREVVSVKGASEPLSRLRPGQRFRIGVNAQKQIVAMEYLHSGGPALRLKRIGGRLQRVSGDAQTAVADTSASRATVAAPGPAAQAKAAPEVSKAPRPTRQQGPVAWAVQVGVYKDWEAARKVQSTLRSKGYPAFLKAKELEGNKTWHLKVGPQLKKSDAVALARKIQQETGSKALVVGYP